jgi:hypothetical protein
LYVAAILFDLFDSPELQLGAAACFGRRRKVGRLKAPISSLKGDPP